MTQEHDYKSAIEAAEHEHVRFKKLGNHEGQRIYETILFALRFAEKMMQEPSEEMLVAMDASLDFPDLPLSDLDRLSFTAFLKVGVNQAIKEISE